jgi:hypothetical protein
MNWKNSENRRDFLRSCGRGAMLTLLGALGIRATRGQPLDAETHRCTHKSVCCRCPREDACPLPAAISARQARKAESGQ